MKKGKNFAVILLVIAMITSILLAILAIKLNSREVVSMKNPKTLIVYYSRTGNTKVVAELIQEKLRGDLVQLETQQERPSDYQKEVEQNEREQQNNTIPDLKTGIPNFEQYDRIFIGFPVWNMALPQAIVTFFNSYNFKGKTVIPFNTNGGYGPGKSFDQVSSILKGANILEGVSIHGGEEINGILLAINKGRRVEVSQEIERWIKKINQY